MSTRTTSLLILLLCVPCWSVTQVIRYVDPDAAGAGTGVDWTNAYTSLNTAFDTEAKDISLATGTDEYYTFNCRSSGGTADTTSVTVAGWSGQDATHYMEVIGTDCPTNGVYSNTAYRIELTNGVCVNLSEGRVNLHNIQIQVTATSGTARGIYMATVGSEYYWNFDSCIIKGVCSGTGIGEGIVPFNGSAVVNVYNCIIYGFISGADTDFNGIRNATSASISVYNCSIYGNYVGINATTQTTNIYNCAVGNNTDDISGTGASADYCCTDDGDGTNSRSPSGGSWANEFYDAANGDFALKLTGNCYDNGTDNPGSGLYSDDFAGTARSSTWSIGAFEDGGPDHPAYAGAQVMPLVVTGD